MQEDFNVKAKCSKIEEGEYQSDGCIISGDVNAPVVKREVEEPDSVQQSASEAGWKARLLELVSRLVRILKNWVSAAGMALASAAGRVKEFLFDVVKRAKQGLNFDTVAGKKEVSMQKKRHLVRMRRKWKGVSRGVRLFGTTAKSKTRHHLHVVKRFTKKTENRPILAMGGTCAAVAIGVFVLALNFSIGFEAVVNGQSIGVVKSEEECVAVVNEVNSELSEYFDGEQTIEAEITTVPKLIPKDQYTPETELKTAVCQLTDKMHEMQVVYLGEEALFALPDAEAVDTVLQEFKNYYTGGDDSIEFIMEQELEVKTEMAPVSLLRDTATAVSILNGSEKKDNEYVIQPGDTLWSISRKYDTTVDELLQINEGLTEDIVDGDIITVKAYVPVVKVTTKQRAEYTESIGYETQVVETEDLYRGKTEIQQEGVEGQAQVVANIVKENGQEVSREVLSSEVVSEPVDCIKLVGTKEPPSGYGTGKFIAPTQGTITSRFGYRRSGYHKGLDIANSSGTPIYASDNGIVTTAGWSGLFGKLVTLDHQNGYVTYYAHNSSIVVSVGDVVQKGDLIAYMGSTGNSTGPHCHFEIHYNGELKNPENYI